MTPTIEEIASLLGLGQVETRPIYCKERNPMSHRKRLAQIFNLSPQSLCFEHKGNTTIVSWQFLKEYIRDQPKKEEALNAFALAIYELVFFPKVLEHVEVAVIELFDQLKWNMHLAPAILAKIIRSLNACRTSGKADSSGVH